MGGGVWDSDPSAPSGRALRETVFEENKNDQYWGRGVPLGVYCLQWLVITRTIGHSVFCGHRFRAFVTLDIHPLWDG